MDEEKPKRKRGHPKGVPSPGSGKKPSPRMGEVLEESGGVILEPPSTEIRKPARKADLSLTVAPKQLMPVPGEASAVPNMITTILAIRNTVDLDNPATLWHGMEMYLNLCANTGMKISNTTLYTACGIDRRTIHDWEYGLRRQNNR